MVGSNEAVVSQAVDRTVMFDLGVWGFFIAASTMQPFLAFHNINFPMDMQHEY